MARKPPTKARRRPPLSRRKKRKRSALGDTPERHEKWSLVRLEAAERALAEGDRELDHDFMEPKHCERALKNLVLAKEFSGEATVHRLSMTLPLKRSDRSEKFHGALKDTWRRFRWKCEVVPKQEYSRRRNRK